MGDLSKLLGITAAGASIVKARLIQRFINDFARIIALSIATGLVVGALLIGGLYVACQGLIYYGLEPLVAEIIIGFLALIMVFVLVKRTTAYIHSLKTIPGQLIHTEFPMASRLNGLVDSFMDGLISGVPQETRK